MMMKPEHATPAWRRQRTVLVTEAQAVGSIAVIRSLGRAGYSVLACAESAQALGLQSNYCALGLLQPSGGAEEFFAWLDLVIAEHGVSLIIPSEGFLLRIRPQFKRFKHLLPLPDDERLVYAGFSKVDLFSLCIEQGLTEALPPFLLLDLNSGDTLPDTARLEALGTPLFLKADAAYARSPGKGSLVRSCSSAAQALAQLQELGDGYSKLLVQGYVPGVGVGAFLARWQGAELASFMHRRLHEVPHTGGASSYRESWHDARVLDDARQRMQCLAWEGVGMFEYRWDPVTDRFYLLEFNSRFWGSLHLALFANVNFPCALADAFFGMPAEAPTRFDSVRARLTFPGELGYVLSCIRDPSLSLARRLWVLLEFLALGLHPKVRSDLWFPGDRKLYWLGMVQSLKNLFR